MDGSRAGAQELVLNINKSKLCYVPKGPMTCGVSSLGYRIDNYKRCFILDLQNCISHMMLFHSKQLKEMTYHPSSLTHVTFMCLSMSKEMCTYKSTTGISVL